jgi:hypothetical protein
MASAAHALKELLPFTDARGGLSDGRRPGGDGWHKEKDQSERRASREEHGEFS